MYGCSSNKTHSAPGAKDVGLRWTRHSAAHWPPGPFSAHTKERGTKTLKAGAAPQRKHLLVIVFDCIMKMMFFFNLGLLRPHYFPLVTWLLYWSSPSLALWAAEGGNIENGPKASPLFTLTPLVFQVFSRQKHKYVDPVHYGRGECARMRCPRPPIKGNDSRTRTDAHSRTNGAAAMSVSSREALRRVCKKKKKKRPLAAAPR